MSDYVSTAATVRPVTIEQVKDQLNITDTADDQLLEAYIDAAGRMLEERTQRCFTHQTRICKMQTFEDLRYVHGRSIYLKRSPVSSVSSISYVDTAGTTTTLPSSDYIVSTNETPCRISEAYNATWPVTRNVADDVTITYVVGNSSVQSAVPANVKQAIKMLVAHWYRNREAVSELKMEEVPLGLSALLDAEHVEHYG